jgi:hypothetical protein
MTAACSAMPGNRRAHPYAWVSQTHLDPILVRRRPRWRPSHTVGHRIPLQKKGNQTPEQNRTPGRQTAGQGAAGKEWAPPHLRRRPARRNRAGAWERSTASAPAATSHAHQAPWDRPHSPPPATRGTRPSTLHSTTPDRGLSTIPEGNEVSTSPILKLSLRPCLTGDKGAFQPGRRPGQEQSETGEALKSPTKRRLLRDRGDPRLRLAVQLHSRVPRRLR